MDWLGSRNTAASMFFHRGNVSMRYLLAGCGGEHCNDYILYAVLCCLVANAILLRLIEGNYICCRYTSSHSEQRSKTRKSRWYCNIKRESRKLPIFYIR